MSAPIYLPDPFEGINKQLMQLAAMRQAQEAQKEQNKIEKEKLKIAQEKHAMEQQQQQTQQASAMQTFLGAVADPSMQQMVQPGLQALGNANMGPQQVNAQINAVAAPQMMGNKVGPSQIDQAREKQKQLAVRQYVKDNSTADEFKQYEMGNAVYQQALAASGDDEYARSMSKSFVPPTAMEAEQLAEFKETRRRAKSKEEHDNIAAQQLKQKYGIDMVPEQAAALWADIEKSDRVFRQNRELVLLRERGENERSIRAKQTKILETLNSNFQQNSVVKSAATAATGYAKIKELQSERGTKMPGHDHIALMDAFVRLATGTVVREQQVKLIKGARSLPESVQVTLSNWLIKGGSVLSEEQVKNIYAAADAMIEPYKRQYRDVAGVYSARAEMNGVDPGLFITDPFSAIPDQFRLSPAERRAKIQAERGGQQQ
jgi:hypothetical protein